MDLDDFDRKILQLLQKDSKISAKEISEITDHPITTVYARIKKLEDARIIKNYGAVLDASKVGKPTTAFILTSITYRAPGVDETLDQRKIAKEVAHFPEVQEVHIITGDWDLLIKVKAENVAAIGNFVVDKLRTVKGIEKTLTCMVFDTIKETLEIQL
ncbi:Lrp/AsnC family transcriptional regulator [Candidatus Bathyarchaeota archaeon]|nr:Lrp/AsnC family transcriptional regulator [Candidatus Bathyarchaeota archaeon]MBS7631657.1 Lrp/AsnC family transcriptional regulator [Candidatus Bathyarchaeota archaeon]